PSSGGSREKLVEPNGDGQDDDEDANANPLDRFTAPQHLLHEFANDGGDGEDDDSSDPLLARAKQRTIASRQNDYHLRRFNRSLDDEPSAGQAGDGALAAGDKTPPMRLADSAGGWVYDIPPALLADLGVKSSSAHVELRRAVSCDILARCAESS
ncbi:U2 snRNP component prp10, partial [Tilletia horrida]